MLSITLQPMLSWLMCGNTKKVTMDRLRRGSIAWKWNTSNDARWSKYFVGQKFVLNCGVEVEIVKLLKRSKAIVRDDLGHEATVRICHLVDGVVQWYISGRSVRQITTEESKRLDARFPTGSRWESNMFGWFTITGHNLKDNTLEVKWDDSGETQSGVYSGYVTEGVVKDSSIVKNKKNLPFKPVGHYVYIAKEGDEVCYVGSGQGIRYSHVNSGISHNYKLNYHHFMKKDKLLVEIYKENMDKESARELEDRLIKELNPKYNFKTYAGGL